MEQSYYFIFKVSNCLYGINSSYVEEVLPLPELTMLPKTDGGVVGVVELRGQLLPVLDLSNMLGHSTAGYRLSDSVIVLNYAQLCIGIIINGSSGIKLISSQEIVKSGSTQAATNSESLVSHSPEMIAGMLLGDEQIWILSDLNNWISVSQVIASLDAYKQQKESVEAESLSLNGSTFQQEKHLIFCPTATDEERAVFRSRAENLKTQVQVQEHVQLQPTVVFGLGNHLLGIDAASVQEFVDIKKIVPVPCCPRHIIGNTNLRGEILTLVDIRNALKIPVSELSVPCKVIVAKFEDIVVGIVVDRIRDAAFLLNAQDIVSATTALPNLDGAYLQGAISSGDNSSQVIGLLNLSSLLLKGGLVVEELV